MYDRNHCLSCGGAYVSELSSRESPLLHHGRELSVRVCDKCRSCQELLSVLKCHNALMLMYTREVSHVNDALYDLTKRHDLLGSLAAPQANLFLDIQSNHVNSDTVKSDTVKSDTVKKYHVKSDIDSASGNNSDVNNSTSNSNSASSNNSASNNSDVDNDGSIESKEVIKNEFIVRHCKRWFNTAGSVFDSDLNTQEFMELVAVKQLAFSDHVEQLTGDAASLIRLLYDNITEEKGKECNDLSSFRLVLDALSLIAKGQTTNEGHIDDTSTSPTSTTSTTSPTGTTSTTTDSSAASDSPEIRDDEYNFEESSVDFNIPQLLHIFFLLLPANLNARPTEETVETVGVVEGESVINGCSLCGAVEELIKLEVLY